jgi:hypothetical protein
MLLITQLSRWVAEPFLCLEPIWVVVGEKHHTDIGVTTTLGQGRLAVPAIAELGEAVTLQSPVAVRAPFKDLIPLERQLVGAVRELESRRAAIAVIPLAVAGILVRTDLEPALRAQNFPHVNVGLYDWDRRRFRCRGHRHFGHGRLAVEEARGCEDQHQRSDGGHDGTFTHNESSLS